MKEILETIITNLVDDKSSVHINQVDGEQSTVFEVKVADSDMGKVIGKQGKVAKAIRTIMKSVTSNEKKNVGIVFEDEKAE